MDSSPKVLVTHHARERVRTRSQVVLNGKDLTSNICGQIRDRWKKRWEVIDGQGKNLVAIFWPQTQLLLLLRQDAVDRCVLLTAMKIDHIMGGIARQAFHVVKKHGQQEEP